MHAVVQIGRQEAVVAVGDEDGRLSRVKVLGPPRDRIVDGYNGRVVERQG